MASTPHYLRVARALALVTGLAGLPACWASHEADRVRPRMDSGTTPTADAGPSGRDAGPRGRDAGPPGMDAGMMSDAGPADAGDVCATCFCPFIGPQDAGGQPTCESVGAVNCCAVIGPLFPPNVPA